MIAAAIYVRRPLARIVLHLVPETPWRKCRVLDEDGQLGPPERILPRGAMGTHPENMIRHALAACGASLVRE